MGIQRKINADWMDFFPVQSKAGTQRLSWSSQRKPEAAVRQRAKISYVYNGNRSFLVSWSDRRTKIGDWKVCSELPSCFERTGVELRSEIDERFSKFEQEKTDWVLGKREKFTITDLRVWTHEFFKYSSRTLKVLQLTFPDHQNLPSLFSYLSQVLLVPISVTT